MMDYSKIKGKVIASKPKSLAHVGLEAEWLIVDRGEAVPDRYVVTYVTKHSLKWGEWCGGAYHRTLRQAIENFNDKPTVGLFDAEGREL